MMQVGEEAPHFYVQAYRLAATAHAGQFRRDGDTPYFSHPLAVANALFPKHGYEIAAMGLLHDVLEDTDVTPEAMEAAGIPVEIVRVVCILTKWEGEPYSLYLDRIKADRAARIVKWADILHNLSDSPTPKQVKKYASALIALSS